MPAAAVIPAPVAYIKVVAVKKLVVRTRVRGRSRGPGAAAPSSVVDFGRPFAFPALSAGVDCHVHPPRGPAGENLLRGWRPVRRSGRPRAFDRAGGIRAGRSSGLLAPLHHPPFALVPSSSPVVVAVQCFVARACLRSGGFSSKGALNRVSAAAGTFTLKKLECSERAVQACIR